MTFVLTMLFAFVYDHKNENLWLLLIIRYSLLQYRFRCTPNSNYPYLLFTEWHWRKFYKRQNEGKIEQKPWDQWDGMY